MAELVADGKTPYHLLGLEPNPDLEEAEIKKVRVCSSFWPGRHPEYAKHRAVAWSLCGQLRSGEDRS